MVVQHNIPALNSHRYLGVNNNAAAKNLEKLSSGFKINRAGDDAAGLAISEKMRGQIRGLAKAEDNTNHAINLIQTAEGGMQEMHSIVQRMRELAVQSTNGTYHNAVDRAALDQEFQQLKQEFDRIVDYTNYNNIKLLNGDPWGTGGTGGAAGPQWGDVAGAATDFAGTAAIPANANAAAAGGGEFDAGGNGEIELVIGMDADGKLTVAVENKKGGSTVDYTATIDATGKITITDDAGTPNTFDIQLTADCVKLFEEKEGGVKELTLKVEGDTAAPKVTYTSSKNFAEVHPVALDTTTNKTGAQSAIQATALDFTAVGATGSKFDPAANLKLDITFSADPKTGAITAKAVDGGTPTDLYTIKQTGADTWEIELTGGGPTDKYTFKFDPAAAGLGNEEGDIGEFKFEVDFNTAASVTATSLETTEYGANAAYTGGAGGGAAAHPAGSDPIGQNSGTRASQSILFQVGANGTADQQVELTLYDMRSQWLGWGTDLSGCTNIETGYVLERYDANGDIVQGRGMVIDSTVNPTTYDNLSVYDLHIKDKNASNIAIEVLYTALNDVSSKRAELGAVQNRLEYTLNNLGVTKENLTAAESTIRDVDMAKEMMDFTKNSILIQSAQAMLAQANTLPQGVLQLLR